MHTDDSSNNDRQKSHRPVETVVVDSCDMSKEGKKVPLQGLAVTVGPLKQRDRE